MSDGLVRPVFLTQEFCLTGNVFPCHIVFSRVYIYASRAGAEHLSFRCYNPPWTGCNIKNNRTSQEEMKMKKNLLKILVTVMVLAAAAAMFSAGTAESHGLLSFTEWKDQLLGLQSFKFQNHKKGLGLGDCPVYTAPYNGALRFANNRQAVDTNKELYEAGKTDDGWLLVRYEPVPGTTRVGYIPPKYVSKFKSQMSIRNFGNVSAVAAGNIDVTDNPIKNGAVFATLLPGDSFSILAKYTYHGNWWYIECTVNGKTARGFIDRNYSSFYPGNDVADRMDHGEVNLQTIGSPGVSPLNTGKIGNLRIKGNQNDERKKVHQDANPDSKWLSVVYPARDYPYYAVKDGTNGRPWYYIFVEEDSAWGWIASDLAVPES